MQGLTCVGLGGFKKALDFRTAVLFTLPLGPWREGTAFLSRGSSSVTSSRLGKGSERDQLGFLSLSATESTNCLWRTSGDI